MIPHEAAEAAEGAHPHWYRCPCGCGWVRDDKAHLIAYLASSGYGLSALTKGRDMPEYIAKEVTHHGND